MPNPGILESRDLRRGGIKRNLLPNYFFKTLFYAGIVNVIYTAWVASMLAVLTGIHWPGVRFSIVVQLVNLNYLSSL
jgi:hypothetical protein